MAEIEHASDPPRLDLLGTFRLTAAGRPIPVSTNGRRILAFLALHGPCHRGYLAGTLWPECSEAHAHGSLRAALSRLQRGCGAGLLSTGDGGLALTERMAVDVDTLVGACHAVLDGTGPAPDHRELLRRLLAGDLLAGWYDDWVLVERERLRQLRLHALDVLSERLLAAGEPAAALDAALATVALEPLRESAHRAVIRVHLAEGNRAEALRQLDRLRRLLRRELGVEPSAAATDLFR